MELLVSVAIIGMLVTILVPTITRAMELARRARCAANLHGLGRALAVYGTEHGHYPHVPLSGAGWQVKIGTGRDVDPADGAATGRNPTSCLCELVRLRYCAAGLFICPSTREKERPEADAFWDFPDGGTISYALMNPYGTAGAFDAGTFNDVPILADASPYFDAETGRRNSTAVVDLSDADNLEARAGNSPNHFREGQNVAVPGGTTAFYQRADVGVGLDNIYTRADADRGVDQGGSIPAAGTDGMAVGQGPAGANDSFLVP